MHRPATTINSRVALRSVFVAGQRRGQSTVNSSDKNAIKSLDSILIANRGEIALRVSRTAAKHGIRTTTLYTNPDATSQHALSSPFAFNLGETGAYLDATKIIEIARKEHCQAIHPGYGFLSENAAFAQQCTDNGIVFIGPPWKAIEDMGDKAKSKTIMTNAGVPCVPGYHGQDQNPELLANEAEKIGYPVLIKAVRGGGGKGMRIVQSATEFNEKLRSAKSESKNSFANDEVLIEKYITTPRHIEVQVFADKLGHCVALGERDCSIQRRHQKILEESPAPNLDDSIRKDIWEKARAAALAVGYEGAGTVEFIFDNDTGEFFFMEMNTRLQVEHPVSEMVTGQDLVHWQILVAEGKPLPLTQEEIEQEISRRGHAIEARIYAENPIKGFVPDSGLLTHVKLPRETSDVRIDSGFIEGDEVSAHYDPMISKLIVRGYNRREAVRNLAMALEDYEIAGPVTNIEFLKRICRSEDFANGDVETGYIEKHRQELFDGEIIEQEILAQAAIGSYLRIAKPAFEVNTPRGFTSSGSWSSGDGEFGLRRFTFIDADAPDNVQTNRHTSYVVEIRQLNPGVFQVNLPNDSTNEILARAEYDQSTRRLVTYFPHTRLTSTMGFANDLITIFSRGKQYRLKIPAPQWLQQALGTKEHKNSVLAPMPCKVLRVDVQAGDAVQKDQPLVVIESMKMETVIRSPSDGIVKRIVHDAGEICSAGTALVEFEDQ
ncbi:putative 3-methylcrotonylcarboxylase subunit alpha [Phaeomoniella chlamydospora]|uniref:Putative 3-methylcrotonylcarboxylase subunit alpha n=1 Tax=Phaeomoniella chlamydospora TaxID=158046 RepID=A0A0G2G627_PHACM|nr:putative 3-methylcrotonylcarboxylase subunit alpha [Phaeomoniella chlamydospora]